MGLGVFGMSATEYLFFDGGVTMVRLQVFALYETGEPEVTLTPTRC